jgi:hypothetical protein
MEYIKVVCARPEIAKLLRHPTGVHFREDPKTPVMWPLDGFTLRRLRDGDVTHVINSGPAPVPQRSAKGKGE